MAQRKTKVSILFVDVCGSTPLYTVAGDADALSLIGDRLDSMASIIEQEGGRVIRSKGDDLLCSFDDADGATRASQRLVGEPGESPIQIRVAVHFGDVINARDDLFGDAVNVAARVLNLARPDEVLLTSEQLRQISLDLQVNAHFLSRQLLKGRAEPVELFKLSPDLDSDLTRIQRRPQRRESNTGVRLVWGEHEVRATESTGPVIVGRAEHCALVIPEQCVSREHAIFEVHGAKVSLTDRSSLGTWLYAESGKIQLRRESTFLLGRGVISLGEPTRYDSRVSIEFEQVGIDDLDASET